MASFIVNKYTSLVPVQTQSLAGGSSVIVYVSTTEDVAQLVTIRDIDGFLSSPQSIRISTTDGALFENGQVSLTLQQRYAYITMRAETPAVWTIVDQNAFSSPTASYDIRGLTFSTMQVTNAARLGTYISTSGTLTAGGSIIQSTLEVGAPLFVSSLRVNESSLPMSSTPFRVAGSAYFDSLRVTNALSTAGRASFFSTLSIKNAISTQQVITVSGDLLHSTPTNIFDVRQQLSTGYRFIAQSGLSTGGFTQILTTARVAGNLFTSSFETAETTANISILDGGLFLSSPSYIIPRSNITVVDPVYTSTTTPVVEVQQGHFMASIDSPWLNANSLRTSNLVVTGVISAPTISSVIFGTAAILNSNGSLTVSSLAVQSISYQTLLGPGSSGQVQQVTAGPTALSSITLQYQANIGGQVTVGKAIVSSLTNIITNTSSFIVGGADLRSETLTISTIFISSGMIAPSLSSIQIPNSLFWNPNGILQTSSFQTSSCALSNSVLQAQIIQTSNSVLFFSTSTTVSFSTVTISSTSAPDITTSSLQAARITFGAPLEFSTMSGPSTLFLTTSTLTGSSANTPYEFITGIGTVYNPLQIVASYDKTTRIYLENISTVSTAYITAQFTYTTTTPGTGTAGFKLGNESGQSTLLSFIPSGTASTIQRAVLSNYYVDRNFVSIPNYLTVSSLNSYPGDSLTIQPKVLAGGINGQINYSIDHGASWTQVDTTGLMSFAVFGFVWGGTRWVAFGSGTTDSMLYSYDGVTWFGLGQTIFSAQGYGGAFGGGTWVACGQGTTNTLAYSSDGITWTGAGDTVFDNYARNVAWAPTTGRWVALGAGTTNTLAYSANGKTWTGLGTSIFSGNGNSLAFGSGRWVAVGNGTNTVAYSDDGISWTGLGTSVFQFVGYDIAWNGTIWVAVGNDATNKLAYSSDGITWTGVNINSQFSSVESIGWTGLYWVVGGTLASSGQGGVARSLNAITWTLVSGSLTSLVVNSVQGQILLPVQTAYPSFTRSIAVGSSATNLMATSADGITWTGTTVPFTGKIHCVAWNGNYWVAGGEGGTYVLAYSTDGINWTGVTLPTITAIYCLAWVRTTAGVNQWVAGGLTVGGKGWASSTDSIAWTEQTAIFTTATYGLVYANGLLYAVGGNNGGGIASSADLVTWTYTASVRPSNIPFSTAFSIAFNGNSFVVVGSPLNYSNTIAFADFDGTYWQGLNGIFSVKGNDVMYGNGLWVAVGEGISHTIAISQNGYEWTGLGTSIFSIAGTGITWNGERFVATGSGTNTLAYSTDGITWVAAGTSIFSTTTYLGTPGQATKVTSQFVGPPTFPLTDFPRTFYTQTSNAAVALNSRTIQKLPNGTNQAWDARVNSVDGVAGSAYLSFRPATNWTNSMMGLSDAPSTTANYSRINFGVNLNSAGNIDIYESGLYVNSYGTYSLSDRFKILFNGSRVFYYKNSTLLRSVARTSLSSLYMCCSMYTPGAKITDIDFHRMYSLVTSNSNFTTSSFVQSEATGINTDLFPPIYYNSGNLGVSQFQLNLAIAGTLSTGISTSLFTDMFINETRYFSTAAQPGLFDRFNTYNFSFFIPSSITLTSNDRVNFRVRGTKPAGQLYLYGNWVNSNATSTLSTQVINVLANPNGMEYLEFYHSSAETGFQTSELQLYISPVSTLSTNYTNSNIGLEVNRGFLRWSSTLNGQTIQNKFNDITTRTITYTNALYNTSDPRMKRDIETVDPTTLVSSFSSLTLRRYAFIGPFLSTFLLEDSHQLGLLTREVEQVLPGLVHEAPFHHLGLDTIQTLDRAQLKFLHLGVTQSLIQRISTLEGRLAGLRCLYPFVEGAENV